jgi:DNA-binding transcriptional MerR regulator
MCPDWRNSRPSASTMVIGQRGLQKLPQNPNLNQSKPLDSGVDSRVYLGVYAERNANWNGRRRDRPKRRCNSVLRKTAAPRPPCALRRWIRIFKVEDIQRIRFIRQAQQLGFSLPEIRELLAVQRDEGRACSHVRDLLRAKVATVHDKIRDLGILEAQLTKSLRTCEHNLKSIVRCRHDDCPVLEAISQRMPGEN